MLSLCTAAKVVLYMQQVCSNNMRISDINNDIATGQCGLLTTDSHSNSNHLIATMKHIQEEDNKSLENNVSVVWALIPIIACIQLPANANCPLTNSVLHFLQFQIIYLLNFYNTKLTSTTYSSKLEFLSYPKILIFK